MKTQLYSLLISIILFINTAFAQVPQALVDSFQIVLNEHVATTTDKGISAAVIMPDGSIWTGVAGDDGSGNAITSTTLFYGASTTKTFVSACILQLLEEGKLSLSDSLYKYVSGTQYPQNYVDSTINIYQLLTHTTGIFNYTDNPNFYLNTFITNPTKVYAPGESIPAFLNFPSLFSKGASWKYCNSNYVLLGLIVEKVTGNTLTHEIETRIINRVVMPHTTLGDENTPNSTAGLWANIGLGEMNFSSTPHTALLTSFWGAGNIVTLPVDLAKYCRELIKGNLYTTSATIDTMLAREPHSLSSGVGYNYGLGIMNPNYNGQELYGHLGNIGHITCMFHNPVLNYTIVSMTNRFGVAGSDNVKAFKKIEKLILNYNNTVSVKSIANESRLSMKVISTMNSEIELGINSTSASTVSIIVNNELGQIVESKIINVLEGYTSTRLDQFNSYAKGIYFIKASTQSESVVVKVVK